MVNVRSIRHRAAPYMGSADVHPTSHALLEGTGMSTDNYSYHSVPTTASNESVELYTPSWFQKLKDMRKSKPYEGRKGKVGQKKENETSI